MAEFDLPESVFGVLPSDPFEQLDIARKITSIALASRVSKLESEVARLRQSLAQKEELAAQLAAQVEALDASLADLSQSLARADQEKAALLDENAALSNTVKKLNRDVSKLEIFKKTLMQSLQEEDENPQVKAPKTVSGQTTSTTSFTNESNHGEEEPAESQVSETGTSLSEEGTLNDTDASNQGIPHNLRLPSLSSTPRFTPPDSPPRLTAALSPPKLTKPVSPRRHSISVTSARNMFNDRSSVLSSMPSSHHSLMTSPFDAGAQTGRTRVDGKEFFRQVRSRLAYEQFTSFLANVKELNSHKQTREETLRKAEEIFGPDNKDLFTIFEGLITRNLH